MEHFDLDGLARYLHLTPMQVQRMADRGQLPGRKIAGEWKFAPAEVHHWLEERIGASDEGELVAMEGVLERHHPTDDVVRIAELLPLQSVDPCLPAKTRTAVIDAMAQLASRSALLWDADRVAQAVRAREELHPTALDNGVALLHPRRPLPLILAEPLLALGRTARGIPFGGAQGGLTDTFFLICSVSDAGHLRTLTRLSRLVGTGNFLSELRAAEDAEAMLETIRRFEADL